MTTGAIIATGGTGLSRAGLALWGVILRGARGGRFPDAPGRRIAMIIGIASRRDRVILSALRTLIKIAGGNALNISQMAIVHR